MDRDVTRLARPYGGVALAFICVGAALLLSFVAITTWNDLRAHAALQRFELDETPDQSLWSEGRIRAFRAALAGFAVPVEGVVTIESVGVRVPVFEGTSDEVLAVGAGWIEGTAPLGAEGNIGIAAHRDGHFRELKDIEVGAEVIVETAGESYRYQVFATSIVDPRDVHVLDPTAEPQLTLVTCYPFYFVGHAPQRFIVHAHRKAGAGG